MKLKVGLAAIVLMGSMGAASAADLPARTYTKAPPPIVEPVYNWTGFYIGANGGGAWGHTSWLFDNTIVDSNHDISGGFAGGQIGYNWQAGAWVFGLEADGDWANITGSALCPNPTFVCATNVRDLASFRGRIGFAANNVLFYGTGGAGYANTHYSALTGGVPVTGTTGFFNTDRWGWTAGAGIEWGFAPNWSAKFEYMHYDFDTSTSGAGTLAIVSTAALRTTLDTVKVGINYRFGWAGGPVVARY